MKRFLIYLIVIIIGAAGVYFFLDKYNSGKDEGKPKVITRKNDDKEVIPSKDDFVKEAIKLQTLAEDTNGNNICKCYNVKSLDRNTTLTGSILVYTSGDLFLSNVWLSNGYYLIEDSENITAGLLDESDKQASLYCGEESMDVQSRLCDLSN